MHILDFVMWIILVIVLWQFMDWKWEGEYTEELGSLIGLSIVLFFTVIYIIIFGVYDNNWSDINFNGFKLPKITW
jgi:hypothetical protein